MRAVAAASVAAPSTSGRVARARERARAPIRARAADDAADVPGADRLAAVRFDGAAPEARAARALADLLTMAAVRVVLDQMQGTRHRSPMAPKLIDHLRDKPLRRDASAWLAELMAHEDLDHRLCAVRIIETRKVLACEDEGFDYDWMRREAVDGTREDGLTLRRAMLTRAHDAGDRGERDARDRS